MLALEFTEYTILLISMVFLGQSQYTYDFSNFSLSDPGCLTIQETRFYISSLCILFLG